MNRRALLIGLGVAGVGLYLAQQRSAFAAALDGMFTGGAVSAPVDSVAAAVYNATGIDMQNWQTVAARPENAIYVRLMHGAEARYGLPPELLVRLAYQESRFRPDIITGKVVSGAGALGIMQIVPRWHPGVNPLDPAAAIDYAGSYIAALFRQFGTWELALQAYNWGPGNLKNYLVQGGALPVETANYSGQILADLNNAGVAVA